MAAGQQLGHVGVAVRQRRQVELVSALLADQLDGAAEDGEVRESEVVELQQLDLLDVVHVVLRRRQRLVVLTVGVGALERHYVGERLARDHNAGGVRACVPRDALQAARCVDQLAYLAAGLVLVAQLVDVAEGGIDGDVQSVRDEARDAVGVAVRHAERATGVADRRLRTKGSEGDDLRHTVAPVALRGVADHLVATVVGEVEVDVRWGDALGVEEALEDEPVLRRFDVGDVEAVEHDRGRRGAAHAHRDVSLAGEASDVVDDQHVLAEPGLFNHPEFVAQPFPLRLGRVGVATVESLVAEIAQVLHRTQAIGHARIR